MKSRTALLLSAAPVLLSSCAPFNEPIGSRDIAFGEALKYDAAIQTINPDPVYAPGGAQPGDNGDKGVQAVVRYRTDAVKDMSSGTSGGGAGAAGGAGGAGGIGGSGGSQ
ncbi:MAG TPA: hypothetical protein VFP53_04840 [Sphingomicrobium sp.]|nr:hypothetical protein [Sphingomicrobium sp.]